MTTRAALYNTKVPETIIQDNGDGEIVFDILDDVERWERIEGWDKVPVAITLNKVKIDCFKTGFFFNCSHFINFSFYL